MYDIYSNLQEQCLIITRIGFTGKFGGLRSVQCIVQFVALRF